MEKILEKIFTHNDIKCITKELFFYSKNHNESETSSYFNKLFKIPYELIGGNENIFHFIDKYFNKYYKNEKIVKSSFAKDVLKKNGYVSFFELALGDNRLDIGTIGSKSIAYEIKTKYDTLDRLQKQIETYCKFFEYVYVICDCSKINDVICLAHEDIGIIEYDDSDPVFRFKTIRKAKRQTNIDSKEQIKIIAKNELIKEFGEYNKNDICASYKDEYINTKFKKIIKNRYATIWNSLSNKSNQICDFDFEAQYRKLKHQLI